jgi:hypothetical protein
MKKLVIVVLLIVLCIGSLFSSTMSFQEYQPDYIIIEGYSILSLQKEVNIKIQEGYVPIGGVAIAGSFTIISYVQAMVLNRVLWYMNRDDIQLGIK